jgi:catechol 2,3-dioxygenase-like lactoylglutathione lyase family enzyme
MTNFVPTPTVPAPDIVRCAYMDIVVTDLAKSREFYVDVLGLHVTEEDENTIYLRSRRSSSTTTWCSARDPSPPSPPSPTG